MVSQRQKYPFTYYWVLLASIYLRVGRMGCAMSSTTKTTTTVPSILLKSNRNNNIHAMIVSSSRYWFNYRHAINALGMYQLLRENNIPDENIILMIADEYVINARNPYKNRMHAMGIRQPSWYSHQTQIDYRGSDVTVQTFLDALLGLAPKSLYSDEDSNVLIYITGHGGDQFFKFQDEEELTAQDIAQLLDRMHQEQKFRQLLFIADTCQAFTLFDKVTTPNVLALGTSVKGENAYAHHSDSDLGLAIIERWTYAFLTGYRTKANATSTLHDIMVSPFPSKNELGAHIGIKEDTGSNNNKTFHNTLLEEFFGVMRGGHRNSTPIHSPSIVSRSQSVTKVEALDITPQSITFADLPRRKKDIDSFWQKAMFKEECEANPLAENGHLEGSFSILVLALLSFLVLVTAIEMKLIHR